MKAVPQKAKSELQKLREEWKEKIKDMNNEQVLDLICTFYNKVYLYELKGKEYCVEVEEMNETPRGFLVRNLANNNEKRLPPWYLLHATELPEREIVDKESDNKLTCRAYEIVWHNWKSYLNKEIPRYSKLGDAVRIARENITADMCPWYPTTFAWKIWNSALIDLSRKMHNGYIPVTTKGEELWDSKSIKTN